MCGQKGKEEENLRERKRERVEEGKEEENAKQDVLLNEMFTDHKFQHGLTENEINLRY